MRKRWCYVLRHGVMICALFVVFAARALGVPTIQVGEHVLLPNAAGQWVDISVSGGDAVSGVDLFLQVGGGGPQLSAFDVTGSRSGPAVREVDFKTDTIFKGVADVAMNVGSTETDVPQVAVWTLSLTGATRTVSASGRLVRVQVDTTGFFGGQWDLKMTDVLPYDVFGGPYATNFAGLAATITNGRLIIPVTRGDYNANQQFDAVDIDALASAIRGNSSDLAKFDLNVDRLVNSLDYQFWIEKFAHVSPGDANMDGQFDSSDFVQVFVGGKYEDNLSIDTSWSEGDWTGDNQFTTFDLVTAFQQGTYEQGYLPSTQATMFVVPEPNSIVLFVWSPLVLYTTIRRTADSTPLLPTKRRSRSSANLWTRSASLG